MLKGLTSLGLFPVQPQRATTLWGFLGARHNRQQHHMELQVYGKKLTDKRIDYYILQGRYGENMKQRLIQAREAQKSSRSTSPRRTSAKAQLVLDLTDLLV